MSPQSRILTFSSLLATLLLALAGCDSKPKAKSVEVAPAAQPAAAPATLDSTDAESSTQTQALALPKSFGRFKGDWDEIAKRGYLRVLVVYNRAGFFYDKGQPRGAIAEAMEEFARVTNKKLKTGAKTFKVVYLPMPPGQLLAALNDGIADIACTAIIVTPEREKLVDFTEPLKSDVKIVVVASKTAPAISSLDDLSGKEIYLNQLSVVNADLEKLNEGFKKAGKPEIQITAVDRNLTDEDLLEMLNAGLIPATISFNFRAQMWAKAFSNLVVTPVVLEENGKMAWAMRKGSPQLKAVMDEFNKSHGIGTAFGNTIIRRYMDSTKWLKNSTSQAEMEKFKSYINFFQQYGTEYNFDYLLLAAQGYQESMLNQDRVSPRGAVGVMQVLPQYAAANPINIPNVRNAQDNIHAGAKMLAQITKTYFNDPAITPLNKTLFTFASYNAGQNRIVRLRKQALAEGLDPNKWFGNVEIMVAKDVGQETVQYVSNIYKYYVAYKMSVEQKKIRAAAEAPLKAK